MKSIARLVLAASALAVAGIAAAEPFDSADQARRERNREEVLSRHGVTPAAYRSGDYRPVEDKSTLSQKTHRAAEATRSFTHRQAEKLRDVGAKTNAKFDKKPEPEQQKAYKTGQQ